MPRCCEYWILRFSSAGGFTTRMRKGSCIKTLSLQMFWSLIKGQLRFRTLGYPERERLQAKIRTRIIALLWVLEGWLLLTALPNSTRVCLCLARQTFGRGGSASWKCFAVNLRANPVRRQPMSSAAIRIPKFPIRPFHKCRKKSLNYWVIALQKIRTTGLERFMTLPQLFSTSIRKYPLQHIRARSQRRPTCWPIASTTARSAWLI